MKRVIVFLLIIGGMSVGNIIVKDREFSENENRYLAEFPKLTRDSVIEGEFQSKLESYMNDQIIGRDTWITAKTAVQKACGDTDIGGAYVGKDGYDFEKITPDDVDDVLVSKNKTAVRSFFDNMSHDIDKDKLSLMLIPTSGYVMQDRLPKNAIIFDQKKILSEVREAVEDYNVIVCDDALVENNEDYIYYKTDHHWTSNGAYIAYCEWVKATKREALREKDFEIKDVTENFKGSLYSKILDYDSSSDTIQVYSRKNGAADISVLADGKDIGGIYQEDKLNEKDKYAYFFGGNYGLVDIKNNSPTASGTLLVIKDSFANAFVPFLTDEYKHILMVDLRYYSGNVSELSRKNEVSEILVLYNVSNFISDKNIYKLSK